MASKEVWSLHESPDVSHDQEITIFSMGIVIEYSKYTFTGSVSRWLCSLNSAGNLGMIFRVQSVMLQRILLETFKADLLLMGRSGLWEARLGKLMKDSLVEKVPMIYWPRTPPGDLKSCSLIISGWGRKLLGWKSRGLGDSEALPLGSWGNWLPGACIFVISGCVCTPGQ